MALIHFAALQGLADPSALTYVATAIPAPRIQTISREGSSIIVQGTGGLPGHGYYLLVSPDVGMSLTNWSRLATNLFGASGTFAFTNTIGRASPRYYVIEMAPMLPSSPCFGELNALGIQWTWGPQAPGVETPVTVALPLGGMSFRNRDGTLRQNWFMDCELALALHRMVQVLQARGVTEVIDLGIYNYRCIGGGTPPDCPLGLSMHGKALAVDIAALVTAEHGTVSVQSDWVIDPDGWTCIPRDRGTKDAFLHTVLCDLYSAGIFTIHLSPNFNADHRDHWHLDLTPNSARFIR